MKDIPDHGPIDVGNIGNYYGGLCLKREKGKDFWSVENYDGYHWEEIPDYLGRAIRKFIKGSKNA